MDWWVWTLIGVGILLFLILIIWLVMRNRRSFDYGDSIKNIQKYNESNLP